jgi:hypothetical protein
VAPLSIVSAIQSDLRSVDTNYVQKTDLEEFGRNYATKTDLENLKRDCPTKSDFDLLKGNSVMADEFTRLVKFRFKPEVRSTDFIAIWHG